MMNYVFILNRLLLVYRSVCPTLCRHTHPSFSYRDDSRIDRVYCIRQKIKRQKIKRQNIKRQNIKMQKYLSRKLKR